MIARSLSHLPYVQGVVHDPRLYSKEGCEEDSRQTAPFEDISLTSHLLSCLSPHDVRSLVHAEDELSQAQVGRGLATPPDVHQDLADQEHPHLL